MDQITPQHLLVSDDDSAAFDALTHEQQSAELERAFTTLREANGLAVIRDTNLRMDVIIDNVIKHAMDRWNVHPTVRSRTKTIDAAIKEICSEIMFTYTAILDYVSEQNEDDPCPHCVEKAKIDAENAVGSAVVECLTYLRIMGQRMTCGPNLFDPQLGRDKGDNACAFSLKALFRAGYKALCDMLGDGFRAHNPNAATEMVYPADMVEALVWSRARALAYATTTAEAAYKRVMEEAPDKFMGVVPMTPADSLPVNKYLQTVADIWAGSEHMRGAGGAFAFMNTPGDGEKLKELAAPGGPMYGYFHDKITQGMESTFANVGGAIMHVLGVAGLHGLDPTAGIMRFLRELDSDMTSKPAEPSPGGRGDDVVH